MPSNSKQKDASVDVLFLLPYQEEPLYSLEHPVQAGHGSDNEREHPLSGQDKQIYNACRVQRTAEALLENTNLTEEGPRNFVLCKGQYLLLRPPENSLRPNVAEAMYFWEAKQTPGKLGRFVRVKWFYRAEDVSERPNEAIGEDELFEAEHFDDIDVEAIAGRCQISPYGEWVSLRTAETKSRDPHPPNEEKNTAPDQQKPDQDALSDTESSYGDNYSSAAVYYYCRRFYDPIKQLFATSKFEDEDADPVEEINRLGIVDDEFDPDTALSSSDEDLTDGRWAIDPLAKKKSRKRGTKRRRKTRAHHDTADKPERVSQFALPTDRGVPETLPCRDEEKEKVRRFLEDAICESAEGVHGGSRCMYISGVPGTGKTATVREVVRILNARRATGDLPPFEAIEVNAMSLPDPNLVYSELYRAITGSQGFAPMHAAQLLEKRFSEEPSAPSKKAQKRGVGFLNAREKGKCIILILDEMDVLVSRKQKVLYDVLEWPTRQNARMAVIGIANTMDLPERMLPRLGSRLGLNRLTYPPYNSEQLTKILNMKIAEKKDVSFTASAIKLCAQKVGAVSGDIRRALEIVRRASEIVADKRKGKKGKPSVAAKHINMAFNDIAGGSRLVALKQLSLFERLFLVSAISLARSDGSFAMDVTCTISAISQKALDEAMRHSQFFKEFGIPSSHELEEACWRITGQRFVIIEKAAVFSDSRVIVNVSADDCSFALSDCELAMAILNPTARED